MARESCVQLTAAVVAVRDAEDRGTYVETNMKTMRENKVYIFRSLQQSRTKPHIKTKGPIKRRRKDSVKIA